MGRFVYFVANIGGSPSREAVLHAAPVLAYAFPQGEAFSSRGCVGPNGTCGVLAAGGDGQDLEYREHEQVWSRIDARAWVGFDKAGRPGPDYLQRARMTADAHALVLADGKSWLVPVVRFLNGNTSLPRVLVLSENGEAEFQVKAEYRQLFDAAQKIHVNVLAGRGAEYSPATLLWFASAVLAVNYRVSPVEVGMLGLVDSQNVLDIADLALDGPTLKLLLDELKKKLAPLPSGPPSATGESV